MKAVPPRRGFTLIEVLVVVAIIALLVAILIPSLHAARERARMLKCLTNQSNLPKALMMFAADHKGYGQLIATQHEWPVIDPTYSKYDYQVNMFNLTTNSSAGNSLWLKPWPIALAKALGRPTLKRAEQYFDQSYRADPTYYHSKFGRQELFECPSDTQLVNNVWSPFRMFGNISYSPNEDVLGVTDPGSSKEGQCWKDGRPAENVNPPRSPRMEAKLDRMVRPSEIVMFCDGGNEDNNPADYPALLISAYVMNGPYLENYERTHGRLPHYRHSGKGGIATGMGDGSGVYLKPLRFKTISGKQYVERYAPRVRVSPYRPGTVPTEQP